MIVSLYIFSNLPQQQPFRDNQTNTGFLNHDLETLHSLHWQESRPNNLYQLVLLSVNSQNQVYSQTSLMPKSQIDFSSSVNPLTEDYNKLTLSGNTATQSNQEYTGLILPNAHELNHTSIFQQSSKFNNSTLPQEINSNQKSSKSIMDGGADPGGDPTGSPLPLDDSGFLYVVLLVAYFYVVLKQNKVKNADTHNSLNHEEYSSNR
jgi:hypothetical protein